MRLIDIDEIGVMPIDITDLPYDRCLLTYLKEDIDDAPTVKAIPIDKVEQIRAEIESKLQGVNTTLDVLVKDDALIPTMKTAKTTLEDVLEIIDKAIKEVSE